MKIPQINPSRKRITIVLYLFCTGMLVKAQPDTVASLPQFLYPEFTKCIVNLKSGESHTTMMNYNTVTGKMIFYQGGVLMELSKPESVDTIFIHKAKFVFHEAAFYEVLVNAPISLFIQHKSDLSSSEKPSAYGAATQTAASTSVSKIYDDKAYNLKLPDNFKVIPSPVYWVRMNNVMYKITSERQFLKIFPSKVAEIKKFINQNNISLKEQDDLIKLIAYCNELKI
jgi:hypothetical protein